MDERARETVTRAHDLGAECRYVVAGGSRGQSRQLLERLASLSERCAEDLGVVESGLGESTNVSSATKDCRRFIECVDYLSELTARMWHEIRLELRMGDQSVQVMEISVAVMIIQELVPKKTLEQF
ncbi:hypothetical protein Htur_4796 (plasmid) [Haloterrigena turkmenica DSM 5511]|uniref:Uncharacterized protein n=1 Tax=Haloterrigena turkmenica (strain ATCC 51198 / DSM 5511 / JCM 9101 / NCIMB 13204 / VKM B-1734 / 4k) TaxID=543526 RepID=D2S2G9_HALTV|nr:hypothetical protein Htur_4796 [Haloterrigena turkmenica DSM 5511]